ncbi:MAG: M48 family metalloprotease [Saprospiraceae bacterium]|nr:M48 family metalloprotease [Saprospiraceae bacterium]
MVKRLFTPILTLALLLVSACAVNPVTGKKDFMLLSEQAEINLGRQSDPSIVAAYGLYQDEALQRFINEKGQQMAAISHRPQLDYEFKILDSPVVNAFAVPGGYVYFTRGILAHFNNEAEFAGVLGHEIGHIAARHSAKQYSNNILFQVGFIAGVVISPEFASFADAAQEGLQLLFLKFSRDNESESDQLGVAYSTEIGYDAHQMADFFQTLQRMRDDESASIPTFMSTHPDPRDRYNTVHQLASQAQQGQDAASFKVGRDSYLQMIDGMIYGEDPAQGFFEEGYFFHPELLFQFPVPGNWQTANSPSQVRMAPRSGDALIIFQLAQENSLVAAAEATIRDNNLTLIDQKTTMVNGFEALVTLSDLLNPQNPQQITRVLSYYLQDGNYIYEFHGLTKKTDYQKYAGTFVSTMEGYRRLTDREKIERKPERIVIRTAPFSGQARDVLSAMRVPNDRLEEVSILNGIDLKQRVDSGRRLKLIERS